MPTLHPGAHHDRAPQAAARRHPLQAAILLACRHRARTVSQLTHALAARRPTIHRHVQQLVDSGLLFPEAPSRYAGRLLTPYRSTEPLSSRSRRQ